VTRRHFKTNFAFAFLFSVETGLANNSFHQDVSIDIIIKGFGLADDRWKASLASFNNKL
jgi:hypothetical protein